ncbi:hypothetical protein ABTE60_21215, partial [Acinetobacter baumannii]
AVYLADRSSLAAAACTDGLNPVVDVFLGDSLQPAQSVIHIELAAIVGINRDGGNFRLGPARGQRLRVLDLARQLTQHVVFRLGVVT